MKNNKNTILLSLLALGFGFLSVSCVNGARKEDKTQQNDTTAVASSADFSYDLKNPVKYNMPQNLFEISGIVFHNGDAKEVFAIQDEDGDLFHLGLNDKEAKFTKFGGKGDYEDVAIYKNLIIVLKSNGELHTFPISAINQSEVPNVVKTKDMVPKAEYEGLFADEKAGLLYILTKENKAETKNKQAVVYSFKIADDGTLTKSDEFNLSFKEIAEVSGNSKVKFRPSALAKNPLTDEWYILSSINKMILITDASFKVKSSQPLDGSLFNQPEGIAFDKDNNLYISNEGGTLAAGNILMFKYKKP
ncbi:SdiA-regulated domain-containing protein [Pedobacter punctiformis]|uniref:SdiA-regulated domain-containing protein n=1 Tax=Pedobacter punctiformis TaxID=3004097 RepID=A0ABT4LCS3_9SPHI|nr:SdiA-regulated domain-containing protein [Pedobacter sp. HCMS5-2]MCZ4245721.1 SdiA-regulated domain-containing protein [Pedobacter sp. HCMS5-2]